jgi:OOP family OmpA-OmpF porin
MIKNTKRLLLVSAALTLTVAGCSTAPKNVAPTPAPAPEPVAAPTPAPQPAPPPRVVAPAPVPAPSYVIEDVHFDFDKATLKPGATSTLDQVANDLQQQRGVRYEVVGYTDSVGSEAYNQGLSERRAEAVRAYLVSHGVSASQLTTRGEGESNPVASNTTSADRAKNRRVEVRPIR